MRVRNQQYLLGGLLIPARIGKTVFFRETSNNYREEL